MISHDTKTIQSWLRSSISSRLRVPRGQIDSRARFSEYALDPARAVAVLSDLSVALGRDLAPALLWDYQTIESLADHLAGAPTALTIDPHAASEAGPQPYLEPVAITGLGCRFPGAPNPSAFWDLLRQGRSAVGEIPPARWNVETFYDADAAKPGKMNTRWGGFLDQIDGFDALFFGISPREAVQIDPQQRLLLEVVWESLEDAGLPVTSLQGSDTGVFLGAMWCDYAQLLCAALPHITQHTATGQNLSLIANRISYTFGFHGPSITVNTSSSSSLVAVHLACQSLRAGECRLAIAGGVNLIITPHGTIAMSKLGTMSPDGRSRAFDARANGYVRGEGAGVVVLKPLSDALAAGDPIYCVIRGSAVNNDGFSKGLAVPNPQAQEALLREAYRRAGVAPRTVHYVEAHAAGTMIGDPIESEALGAVLSLDRPAENPLVVGSVKTNIGHLESAAGIAGLIKLALSIKHRTIPPSLHFEQPPPQLDLAGRHLQVQQTCAPWPHEEARALAGVSSFGFGGTNCHVVLEEFRPYGAPALSIPAAGPQSVGPPVAVTPEVNNLSGDEVSLVPRLFLLSAHTSEALAELAQATQSWLSEETTANFHDLCYTASVRRSHLSHRLALLASSTGELRDHLQSFLSSQPSPSIARARATAPAARPVWLFPGLGGHFHGMGRELYAQEPVFRRALELCDSLVKQHTGWSVIEQVLADEAQARLRETEVVLPVLFSVEVSMAQMLRDWGIEGAAVIGYSLGEVAAAHVAGVLALEEAVRVVCERARLMGRLDGQGQMIAVEMSEAEAARLANNCGVSIGAVNSLRSVVLSGGRAAMEEVVRRVEAEGVKWQDVGVESAYHSEEMRELGAELRKRLGVVRAERAATVVYSTVCGERIRGDEMGADYWVRHMVERVEFGSAVRRAAADGYEMYVEVGGQPVLKGAVRAGIAEWQAEASQEGGSAGEDAGASEEALVVSTMRRGRGEREEVLRGVSELWVRGCEVQWGRMYDGGGEVVRLPSYPWQRERFWIESGALMYQPLPTTPGPEKASELGPSLQPHGNGVAHVSKNGNGKNGKRAGGHVNGNGKLVDQKQLVMEMCEHPPRLLNYLREQAARVLQLESSRLDPGTPLIRLGIESLMSLELKLRIEHELGLKLAAGCHLQDLSVAQLATQLSNQLTLLALLKPDDQELSQASAGGDAWETWRI